MNIKPNNKFKNKNININMNMNETVVAAGNHSVTYGMPGIIHVCGNVFLISLKLWHQRYSPLFMAFHFHFILPHLDIYEQATQSYCVLNCLSWKHEINWSQTVKRIECSFNIYLKWFVLPLQWRELTRWAQIRVRVRRKCTANTYHIYLLFPHINHNLIWCIQCNSIQP